MYKRTSISYFRIKAYKSYCTFQTEYINAFACSHSDWNTMSAIELCIHDNRYKVERTTEGQGYVSNCTLRFLYPVHVGVKVWICWCCYTSKWNRKVRNCSYTHVILIYLYSIIRYILNCHVCFMDGFSTKKVLRFDS